MGSQEPRLSGPAERERSAAKDRTWGVNMFQFVLSPTHLSHTTLLQPFQIKCDRYIFLKKCVHLSLLLIFFFCVYMCIAVYVLRSCNIYLLYIYIYIYIIHGKHCSATEGFMKFITTLEIENTIKCRKKPLRFRLFVVVCECIWVYVCTCGCMFIS